MAESPSPRGDDGHGQFAYGRLNRIVEDVADALGPLQRPNYTWGMVHAAHLAKALKVDRISVLELGVAGGNGLIAMDLAAPRLSEALGVAIDVYGFDTGSGLPKPSDNRDLPNLWASGDFPMDEARLRSRLQRAQLLLGPVSATIPAFLRSRPAPIGFVAFDLDLYSSTVDAMPLLEAEPGLMLPRVHCYFDDILGFTFAEFNGERLAMAEFNAKHPARKISPIHGLRFYVPARYANANWTEKYFLTHILDHPSYAAPDGLLQLPRMDLDAV